MLHSLGERSSKFWGWMNPSNLKVLIIHFVWCARKFCSHDKVQNKNRYRSSFCIKRCTQQLMAKIAEDNPSIMFTKVNFELLCDVNLFISLACLLSMSEILHALIKFTHKRDVFVCNYVVTIKIYQGQLYFHYVDLATQYVYDIFKDFQAIITMCI